MYEDKSEHTDHERTMVFLHKILCEWSLILYGQNICVFQSFPGEY
jgi:hypothetical protein